MSVSLIPWGLSNPSLKLWVVTVLVIIVISWSMAANAVRAFVDVTELLTMLYAGRAVQQRRTATATSSTGRH